MPNTVAVWQSLRDFVYEMLNAPAVPLFAMPYEIDDEPLLPEAGSEKKTQ